MERAPRNTHEQVYIDLSSIAWFVKKKYCNEQSYVLWSVFLPSGILDGVTLPQGSSLISCVQLCVKVFEFYYQEFYYISRSKLITVSSFPPKGTSVMQWKYRFSRKYHPSSGHPIKTAPSNRMNSVYFSYTTQSIRSTYDSTIGQLGWETSLGT